MSTVSIKLFVYFEATNAPPVYLFICSEVLSSHCFSQWPRDTEIIRTITGE